MAEVDAGAVALRLRARGVLGPLDWHFAKTLAALSAETSGAVLLAAGLVSRAISQGHVCLDLRSLDRPTDIRDEADEALRVDWPEIGSWTEALRRSPLVGSVAGPAADSTATPLVLEGGRLYTRRYWLYERGLAADLTARCVEMETAMSAADVRSRLDGLFGPPQKEIDWQRVAAAVALRRGLCVVSGGPGTGKTHTVAKILVLLAEDARQREGRLPDVLLLAPTGKAANRLGESLATSGAALDCDSEVRDLLAGRAQTVHRALGRDPRWRSRFRHNADNPLLADIVVVDEASMIDISMMAKLLAAVPARARIILLGDRDQLSSVEAGAILGDLCGDSRERGHSADLAAYVAQTAGEPIPVEVGAMPAIGDSVVQLRRNYRYRESSGIGRLALAVNQGDGSAALAILAAEDDQAVSLRPALDAHSLLYTRCEEAVAGLFGDAAVAAKLRALTDFRIVCALRRGPFGVETLNRDIESRLRASGVIADGRDSYSGRPIMVLRNDRETGLFNGDVGLCHAGAGGDLAAYFAGAEGVRMVALARLPAHETVYAMTIHKSQGSEFDEVAIVLPDRPSPLLTRELLYTAVTRARRKVTIYASPEIVRCAVEQRVERASGLRERLWGGSARQGECSDDSE